MDQIAGMSATGRKLLGPASDLWELQDDKGYRHTAIVFHPEYRKHNAINDALKVVLGFLESPMVTGLCELVAHDQETSAFVYPTGECWSVAEVIRTLSDLGEPGGVRAGLELMYAAGHILLEAADNGASEGVYSHGGLTPWRVMLKSDGQIVIVGHALPQVEILQFHENERQVPREDSFRYCPPERIEAQAEDLSSDLFGLALIAFELMTGKPVYDGLVNDIRQQAARAEGSRRLFRFRSVLPDSVRDLLTQAIRPAPEDRFEDGSAFLHAVRKVIASPEATGESLMDLMARVSVQRQRSGKQLDAGKTQMLSRDDIKAMLDDGEAPDEGSGKGKSWSPPPQRARSVRRTTHDAVEESPKVESPRSPPLRGVSTPAASEPRSSPRTSAVSPVRRSTSSASSSSEAAPGDVASLSTSSRWSRVSRSSPRKANPQEQEDLDGAEQTHGSDSGADAGEGQDSGPRSRGPRRVPRRAPSGDGGRPSALDIIARVRSSGDPQPAPDPAPPGPSTPSPGPGGPGTSGDKPPAAPDTAWTKSRNADRATAAQVLDRILGASADRAPGERPVPAVPAPTAPVVARPPSVPGTPPPAPRVVPPPPALVAPPPPAQPAPVSSATPGLPLVSSLAGGQGHGRAPEQIPSERGKGKVRSYAIALGSGGAEVKVRLPGSADVPAAVGRMVGALVPARIDFSGALRGWYRLDGPEGPVPPATLFDELDASATYTLRFVPNRVVLVTLEVRSAEAPARFNLPVATAVPVVSLVDYLCDWLGLPAGGWHLEVEGEELGPYAIIDDLLQGGGALGTLVLAPDAVEG